MRPLVIFVSIVAAASSARAGGSMPKLDASALPEACRWTADAFEYLPAKQQLAALTSAANCIAIVRMRETVGGTPEGLSRALSDALGPSFQMLDAVIAAGDLQSRLLAQYAKADLVAGVAVYIASSAGGSNLTSMTAADQRAFLAKLAQANTAARPWRDRAASEFREVTALASTEQGRRLAMSNPVIAYAIHDARTTANRPVIGRR